MPGFEEYQYNFENDFLDFIQILRTFFFCVCHLAVQDQKIFGDFFSR